MTSCMFDGARYYKRVFGEFFVATDTNAEINSPITVHASEYHRFGWLLFLALRVHAFSRFKDLVTCTNGLISILVSYILIALYFVNVPVESFVIFLFLNIEKRIIETLKLEFLIKYLFDYFQDVLVIHKFNCSISFKL